MYREIVFRAKRKNNRGWVKGDLVNDKELGIMIKRLNGIHEDIDEKTIGQYTGFKDTNGKEIFEGDVIEYDRDVYSVEWDKHNGKFIGTKIDPQEDDADTILSLDDFSSRYWFVLVGNKYDYKFERYGDEIRCAQLY